MAPSIINTYAYAQRPDMAFMTAAGIVSTVLTKDRIFLGEGDEAKLYTGRLLIHSTRYASKREETEAFKFLKDQQLQPEQAPEASLLGWAKIKEVKEYTENTFAIDVDRHCKGESLPKFQQREGWEGLTVYGYVLENIHLLKIPVMGLTTQQTHGTFWTPEDPFDVICFKTALDKERVSWAMDNPEML